MLKHTLSSFFPSLSLSLPPSLPTSSPVCESYVSVSEWAEAEGWCSHVSLLRDQVPWHQPSSAFTLQYDISQIRWVGPKVEWVEPIIAWVEY